MLAACLILCSICFGIPAILMAQFLVQMFKAIRISKKLEKSKPDSKP